MTYNKPQPTLAQMSALLATRHDGVIEDLRPLKGGFWSSAHVYRVGADEFVLRVSNSGEGFAIDAAAMRFASAALPVPTVVETGEAFGAHFAISRRHRGRFIENAPAHEADAVGTALAGLLAALRAAPCSPNDSVEWYEPAGSSATWHSWLLGSLKDDPSRHVSGWREKLARDQPNDALFRRCEARINELLPVCPERRDLVHGDLLHQNVLVADDDAARVTAVFSWKCSARGDFLYDVAWCTFWCPWHPVIAGADLWQRTFAAPDLREEDLQDAHLRHHCYELQIAASHFGWHVWTDDVDGLAAVARAAERTLERGPIAR